MGICAFFYMLYVFGVVVLHRSVVGVVVLHRSVVN